MTQPAVLYEYAPENLKRYVVQCFSTRLNEWVDYAKFVTFEEARTGAESLGESIQERTRVIDMAEVGSGE